MGIFINLTLIIMSKKQKSEKMPVVNHHVAGIDVGGKFHYVAIGQSKEDVRKFGAYTSDLHMLAKYLIEQEVQTVAMESTGDYWQSLFILLQDYGLEVILVNGKFTKNVRGKKTDVLDCQWIQKLHSLGLLAGSFLPDNFTEAVRIYSRHRKTLLLNATDYIRKMQKALRLMNIRLDNVLRDVTGKSGTAIIESILNGERDPQKLADLADWRVKKSKEEIALALTGDWRNEYIFELQQCYDLYKYIIKKIELCDIEIDKTLVRGLEFENIKMEDFDTKSHPKKKKLNKNDPKINIEKYAFLLSGGINLTAIDGISRNVVLTLLSEVGLDMSKFTTAKHFCSWLGLAPNNKISGGKVLSSHTPKRKNRLAEALRNAANVIGNLKDNPLSEFFHRVAYKKGRMVAITATARKLATIIWNMLTKKEQFETIDNEEYKKKIRDQRIKKIQRQIIQMQISSNELKLAG